MQKIFSSMTAAKSPMSFPISPGFVCSSVMPRCTAGGNWHGFRSQPFSPMRVWIVYTSSTLDEKATVVTSDAYKDAAAQAGIGADWVGPEASQKMVDDAYTALEALSDVVN